MRIFKSYSGRRNASSKSKHQQNQLAQNEIEPIDSIGSELAASDQFDIVVLKKYLSSSAAAEKNNTNGPLKHGRQTKNSGGTIMSYFSSDNDDSTVSSITEGDNNRGTTSAFYRFNSPRYDSSAAASSLSSWCCCSGNSDNMTQPTFRSGTDNTLLARDSVMYGGALQPTDSRSLLPRSRSLGTQNKGFSGDNPASVAPNNTNNKRPKLLSLRGGVWGRKASRVNSEMSASLFDNLSEDDLEEEMNRPANDENNYHNNNKLLTQTNSNILLRKGSKPMRRAINWKRK